MTQCSWRRRQTGASARAAWSSSLWAAIESGCPTITVASPSPPPSGTTLTLTLTLAIPLLGGFTVTKWHHPSCFKLHCLRVDYAPTDRAKDVSDGTPISKGQPRLVIGEGGSYRKYAAEGSNPGLADRVPGRSATHTLELCLGQDV